MASPTPIFNCCHCGAGAARFSCAKCSAAFYCSKDCQSLDWAPSSEGGHKVVCWRSPSPPPFAPRRALIAKRASALDMALVTAAICHSFGSAPVHTVLEALTRGSSLGTVVVDDVVGHDSDGKRVVLPTGQCAMHALCGAKPGRAYPLVLFASVLKRGASLPLDTWARLCADGSLSLMTPLGAAIGARNEALVAWLLEHGGPGLLSAPCYEDADLGNTHTPLTLIAGLSSCEGAPSPLFHFLLRAGADADARTPLGWSVLEIILNAPPSTAFEEAALALIARGATHHCARALSHASNTPGNGRAIDMAARNGYERAFCALLAQPGASAKPCAILNAYGSPVPEQHFDTVTYIALVVERGHVGVLRAALAAGVDANSRSPNAFKSPLLTLAANYGQIEAARILLDHGADVNAICVYRGATKDSKTIVMSIKSTTGGDADTIKMRSRVVAYEMTALDAAVASYSTPSMPLIELLLSRGARSAAEVGGRDDFEAPEPTFVAYAAASAAAAAAAATAPPLK